MGYVFQARMAKQIQVFDMFLKLRVLDLEMIVNKIIFVGHLGCSKVGCKSE